GGDPVCVLPDRRICGCARVLGAVRLRDCGFLIDFGLRIGLTPPQEAVGAPTRLGYPYHNGMVLPKGARVRPGSPNPLQIGRRRLGRCPGCARLGWAPWCIFPGWTWRGVLPRAPWGWSRRCRGRAGTRAGG